MSKNKSNENLKRQERLKAYKEPTKEVMEAIAESQRRVNSRQKRQREQLEQQSSVDVEQQQYEILVGQLKSAEARNRLRLMKVRYENATEREVGHLIACQPTALRAIRLESIMQQQPPPIDAASSSSSRPSTSLSSLAPASAPGSAVSRSDRMTKADRTRVNKLMSDM